MIFPSDNKIFDNFLNEFKTKVKDDEYNSIKNIISRYYEKIMERNNLHHQISTHLSQNSLNIIKKLETLNSVKAIKKSKELEREQLRLQNQNMLKSEAQLLKKLETSKLEIESGRKEILKDALQQIKNQSNESHKRNQSTMSEDHEEEKRIQLSLLEKQSENIEILQKVCIEESKLKLRNESILVEINDQLKSEIKNFQETIISKQEELIKLEDHFIAIENSVEEVNNKLNSLAEKKKDELLIGVRRLAKYHGGEKSYYIDKLYQIRSDKETELFELEMEYLKNQKKLSEDELEKSLEILKLKARQEVFEQELGKLKQNKRKARSRFSCSDFYASGLIENLESVNKTSIEPHSSESKTKIKEECSRNSSGIPRIAYKVFERNRESSDNLSIISSEIPYPQEIHYKLSEDSSLAEKKIFSALFPLLEGCIVYKKFGTKLTIQYDPLENTINPPESCGYAIRKIKLNKQLTKLEIRHIGKPGVENNIMVDSIIGLSSSANTLAIIKSQKIVIENADKSLESLARYSKEYREMKNQGQINYKSTAFILKSQECTFFPFFLMLKNGKIELIAESINDYMKWANGITALVKNKKELEKIKFKIIQ